MQARKIKEGIYWVGGIDWSLRLFHGYSTPRGTTYNAYLVVGEKKTALIDTVKSYLSEELLERVSSVIDLAKLDYLVCNHVEMDHSGAIPRVLERAPNATVVTCANGEKGLREHFHRDFRFQQVKTGDKLDLGGKTLSFVTTPMVHWPDNMVCYLPEDRLLFSNDSFGQHYASPERFDDELPLHLVVEEAQKYFGNIVLCFLPMVAKALEAVSGLDIDMIAPSHGLIWRSHVRTILEHYKRWTSNQPEERAIVVYDTMWDSTAKMARAISGAFENRGVPAKLYDLKESHISEIMTDVVVSRYICVGSPTLNNSILPTVASFLTYLRSLSPKKRVGLAFGSYGWGGQSIEQVNGYLKDCGFDLLEPVKAKYVPDAETLHAITAQVEKALAGLAAPKPIAIVAPSA
ncbi:MAG: FprA family A-type flavoprotein [Deltaproteobacteria bacterium]|nr:FprA family A-type flavoprotein [Deltaproteobacteria bacterium]